MIVVRLNSDQFNVGGIWYGIPVTEVKIPIGCDMGVETGLPSFYMADGKILGLIDYDGISILDSMWNESTWTALRTVRIELSVLVQKGLIKVSHAGTELTPGEILVGDVSSSSSSSSLSSSSSSKSSSSSSSSSSSRSSSSSSRSSSSSSSSSSSRSSSSSSSSSRSSSSSSRSSSSSSKSSSSSSSSSYSENIHKTKVPL
jgi:hypothetical protein